MWGVGTIFYTMLMGETPFTEHNIPKLQDKVIKAEYDRESERWMSLSPEAREII